MVHRDQLVALGLGGDAIEYRSSRGRLLRIHRGVYAVGHLPHGPLARASAALLACGPQAVLIEATALALWGLTPSWPDHLEVAGTRSRSHRGVRTRRIALPERDVTVQRGLRVTTPARTLVDVGGKVPDRMLVRMVNEARRAGLVTLAGLERQMRATRGRSTKVLRGLLGTGTAPTRSGLEDAFLAFCRRHRLPLPEVNQRVDGHEVDAVWRDRRLVAELDHPQYHDDPFAFEVDRERDADLLAAGWRVLRITGERLDHQPRREAARLRRLLSR